LTRTFGGITAVDHLTIGGCVWPGAGVANLAHIGGLTFGALTARLFEAGHTTATIAAGQIFGLAGIVFTMPVLAVVTVVANFLQAHLRVRPTAAPGAPPPNSLPLGAVPQPSSGSG